MAAELFPSTPTLVSSSAVTLAEPVCRKTKPPKLFSAAVRGRIERISYRAGRRGRIIQAELHRRSDGWAVVDGSRSRGRRGQRQRSAQGRQQSAVGRLRRHVGETGQGCVTVRAHNGVDIARRGRRRVRVVPEQARRGDLAGGRIRR